MDVLELPRPVINFLRTMAKEGCRYVLSWDIFGGTDAVTLTLTWKLNDDQTPQQSIYDDLQIRHNDATPSPRRSRRDENGPRPSRGKSLEDRHLTPNRTNPPPRQPQVSSLERSPMIRRQKQESDPIYANLCHMNYPTNPSPSFPSPPVAHIYHRHPKQQQQCEIPILRKPAPATRLTNDISSKSRRVNHIATPNDEDDDTLDPWIKRFDCSLEDHPHRTTPSYDDESDKNTSGKVKFKKKPDYF